MEYNIVRLKKWNGSLIGVQHSVFWPKESQRSSEVYWSSSDNVGVPAAAAERATGNFFHFMLRLRTAVRFHRFSPRSVCVSLAAVEHHGSVTAGTGGERVGDTILLAEATVSPLPSTQRLVNIYQLQEKGSAERRIELRKAFARGPIHRLQVRHRVSTHLPSRFHEDFVFILLLLPPPGSAAPWPSTIISNGCFPRWPWAFQAG